MDIGACGMFIEERSLLQAYWLCDAFSVVCRVNIVSGADLIL